MNELVPYREPARRAFVNELVPYREPARQYQAQARSENTKRAYATSWRQWVEWCEGLQLKPLPADPQDVAAFLAHLAQTGRSFATISVRIAAISQAHRIAPPHVSPRNHPAVREVLKGIRRAHTKPPNTKNPILARDLKAVLKGLSGPLAPRNRAILLLGFTGALRRSEITNLDLDHLEWSDEGLTLTIHGKTGMRQVSLPSQASSPCAGFPKSPGEYCPVQALRDYFESDSYTPPSESKPGIPVFANGPKRLSDKAVARLVKRSVKRVGLDPALFSGHSLRAGFVTAASVAGKPVDTIMTQTGHKSFDMVRRYIRRATRFEDNAADGLLE